MTKHLLQPMPLSGELTSHASASGSVTGSVTGSAPTPVFATLSLTPFVPTYLGSWQIGTDQRPAAAKHVAAGIAAAARTAAAPATNKRHNAMAQATTKATKAVAKAGDTISTSPISTSPISTSPISTSPISTNAFPATQGSSPRRSPA